MKSQINVPAEFMVVLIPHGFHMLPQLVESRPFCGFHVLWQTAPRLEESKKVVGPHGAIVVDLVDHHAAAYGITVVSLVQVVQGICLDAAWRDGPRCPSAERRNRNERDQARRRDSMLNDVERELHVFVIAGTKVLEFMVSKWSQSNITHGVTLREASNTS